MSEARDAHGVKPHGETATKDQQAVPSTPSSWQAELQALIAEAQAFEAHARPILARVPDCTGETPDGAFEGAPEWLCELYDQVSTERLQREG